MTGSIPATRICVDIYQQALEKAALAAGTQPNDSVEYKAEDLTDDQLTELLITGRLKKA